jgi:hypothetical protein
VALVAVALTLVGRRGERSVATGEAAPAAARADTSARHTDSAAATVDSSAGSTGASGGAASGGASAFRTALSSADSAIASRYAVELESTIGTAQGALQRLGVPELRALPAATLAPVSVADGAAPWYRVRAGAFQTRARADSLLVQLRRRGLLDDGAGQVVRAPYAFLVQAGVTRGDAARLVASYRHGGIPAYALMRPDGTVRLYAGAFQTPAEGAALAAGLREAGVEPVLVYRIGSAP